MEKFKDNRYLPLAWLEESIQQLGLQSQAKCLGRSEENRPIYGFTLGTGNKKVLMWSQMHGNETTTTKAVIDLLAEIQSGQHKALLEQLTLYIIPMLNPDGAVRYTRLNANEVDLNRDAVNQTQKEAQLLVEQFHRIQPDLCLNLHGQRTIFSAGSPETPASLSFLAPSYNTERLVNPTRSVAMKIIAEIAAAFPEKKGWGIGRYDDGFNLNCMGDYFTHKGTPTILFEAGHYPGDYQRKHTKTLIHKALIATLWSFSSATYTRFSTSDYFAIPENKKSLCDIELYNVTNVNNNKSTQYYQYKEVLEDHQISFVPEALATDGKLYGLKRIDFSRLDENITNSKLFDNNQKKWFEMFNSM